MLPVVIHQIYSRPETYTGVRATPLLVGREEIFGKIETAVRDRTYSYLFYITGRGGTGKTRVIQQALKNAAQDPSLMVAEELIDLYHTRVRSVGGLIGALLEVVKPLGNFIESRPSSTEVDEKLQALFRAEQEGLSAAEVISRRQELTDLFLEAVNQFTANKRLVLALDTAERLFVERDVAQERLGLAERRPAILDWLLVQFLPKVQNSVILLAGRYKPRNLAPELTQIAENSHKRFHHLDLPGLSEAEALDYFDALIKSAAQSRNPADILAAEAISRWSQNERLTIFYCLHDLEEPPRIRPILLALAIDHLVVAGRPLEAFTKPLAEAKALTNEERRAIRAELGKALVRTLREHRRPADDIIITLGWLRKGADAKLLAHLTGLELAEVEAALRQIEDLSFVKKRPADNRIFLHDEMYTTLQHYGLDRIADAERDRVFKALRWYYEQQLKQARAEILQLYRPQAQTTAVLPDPKLIILARARLQDAIVEDFHYRLRWDLLEGFQDFFRYSEEAAAANDESLGIQLRAEFLGFLAERDPSGQAEEIDGLRRADIIADSAVRWIEWLWNDEEYQEARAVAECLRTEAKDIIEAGGDLAAAALDSWDGIIWSYQGDYDKAVKVLNQAIAQLQQWPANARSLRWAGILAWAYNVLGYVYTRLGQYYRAIEIYAKAIPLWRLTKIEVNEAATLNNRAFDLAEVGAIDAAIPLARQGLILREQLGPRVPVGLSINTLALIELFQFDLEGARRDARRALEIFTQLDSARGQGLAFINLAEAEWRMSESATYLQEGRTAELLEEAANHADEAVHIFTSKVNEHGRLVEALIAKGRAYREWARVRQERPNVWSKHEQATKTPYTVAELARRSQEALQYAADLAESRKNIYRQLEALLDLARLRYYMNLYPAAPNFMLAQAELEAGLLAQIEEKMPDQYKIRVNYSPEGKDLFQVQLGKLELLRGHIAFNRWRAEQDITALSTAIKHYTFCLAYYGYYSDHLFQDKRHAQDRIYYRLSSLQPAEMALVYHTVAELEAQYGPRPGRSRSYIREFLESSFGPAELFAPITF